MSDHLLPIAAPDAAAPARADRRAFFTDALAAAALGASALAVAAPAAAQTTSFTEADILNYLLQIEYLQANYFAFATAGAGLATADTSGTGTAGTVTAGAQVNFAGDALTGACAKEMAADDLAHVRFLRTTLGTATVAQPAIDLGFAATGAFSTLARAAGLVGEGAAFNPYASPDNFLLGAFMLKDVAVTAYKGAAALVSTKSFLESIVGIMAVEAHHAATIRTILYDKGIIEPTEAISGARDALDGGTDLDQGIRPSSSTAGTVANIAPLDGDGIAFARDTGLALNVLYLNRTAVSTGGFFPSGLAGTVKTSAAS